MNRVAPSMVLVILLLGVSWLRGRPAWAQLGASNRNQDAAQKDTASEEIALEQADRDRAFMTRALAEGMGEIQLGQLALQRSNNPEVKEFGEKMIADHTRIGRAMGPVAERLGVGMPTKGTKSDGKTVAKLSMLSGAEFDHAYARNALQAHQDELKEFEEEASSTTDVALQIAVARGAEIIHLHLQLAEQMAADQGVADQGVADQGVADQGVADQGVKVKQR